MRNHLWVVEILFTGSEHLGWQPTTSVGLNREEGRRKEADWANNKTPDDKVRLREYERKDK